MRWSMVRLIARREIRDQLRDRRTLFLVFGLPVLLYPLFAVVGIYFARLVQDRPSVIGVVRADRLAVPRSGPDPAAWMLAGGPLAAVDPDAPADYPPLLAGGELVFNLGNDPDVPAADLGARLEVRQLDAVDERLLVNREVDVILEVPEGFTEELLAGGVPELRLTVREGEDTSKLAARRLRRVLDKWRDAVKAVRFVREGLPPDFDEVVTIRDPLADRGQLEKTTDELRDSLVRVFPLLLIMWTLAGSLHPAIDMTAGEKERGTMETLLISPAERFEVVAGKFLTTCAASYATALWNVCWLAGGALLLQETYFSTGVISIAGLMLSVLLALPLAALFSAVSLGLGIYARSTKEGQYYLVPLFLITLPLCFAASAPGVELDLTFGLVPVTGMALLQQQLMSVAPAPLQASHFFAVLGVTFACIAVAMWWAVRQFHRESILFREGDQMKLFKGRKAEEKSEI